jgi:hypothetical protein
VAQPAVAAIGLKPPAHDGRLGRKEHQHTDTERDEVRPATWRDWQSLDAARSGRRQLSIKPICAGLALWVFLAAAFFFADRR